MPKLIKINDNGSQSDYAGKAASAGAGDAGEFITRGSDGKIDPSNYGNGIGADAITATAGEALAAGDMVYISATGTILKADNSAIAKAARGYTLTAVVSGQPATIYFDESNTSLSGLTPGATYYISGTAGQVVTPAPAPVAGQITQKVGFAVNATTLHINIQRPVLRT